jgi:hypothetical protein
MTINQSGETLTIILSSRGLSAMDSTWSGSIDRAGRIAAMRQVTQGDNVVNFLCGSSQSRRVVLKSSTASLSYPRGGTSIEGSIVSRSDVTDSQGVVLGELIDTTYERVEREQLTVQGYRAPPAVE